MVKKSIHAGFRNVRRDLPKDRLSGRDAAGQVCWVEISLLDITNCGENWKKKKEEEKKKNIKPSKHKQTNKQREIKKLITFSACGSVLALLY